MINEQMHFEQRYIYTVYTNHRIPNTSAEEARIDLSCTEVKLLKKIYFVMTFYLICSKHLSGTKCIAQRGDFIFGMIRSALLHRNLLRHHFS